MKKFYTSLFTIVLLFSALISEAQIFNSITNNSAALPGGPYTLDDARFWVGAPPQPGNPCNGCTINIFSDVSMVQNGQSSVAAYNSCVTNPADPLYLCTFLNDVVINGGTIQVFAGATLTVSTYLELFNTQVILGSDATSPVSIKINGQIDLNGTASIRLANENTFIDANNTFVINPAGPHEEISNPGAFEPGIYAIIPADPQGFTYTQTLNQNYLGSSTNELLTNGGIYGLNCAPVVPGSPNTCSPGFVFGPAITAPDATYGVIFGPASILPVQLVQFIGTKQDDGTVKLNWATAQESNAAYYDVERSGTSTTTSEAGWVAIGRVAAKGNSSITTNYTLTDKTPLPGTGYYKLKMVDNDSKTAYSKIIAVSDLKDDRPLVIYNNPFTDQIRLKVNLGRAQELKLTVTDMLGRSVITSNYPAAVGDNYINLTPNAGGSGMYILHITGDTYDKTVKLEKQ